MAQNVILEDYKPQKPVVKLLYNGKEASTDFSKYLNSLTFDEFEDGESDELKLALNDEKSYFSSLWYPKKGDKLTCSVMFGADEFNLGVFTIDENNFDFQISGDSVQIRALSASINEAVRTKKIKNYTGKTLNQIANEIGKSYGFKVLGNTGNVKIGTVVQKNESDLTFLKRISKFYGYIFNIKDGLLTFVEIDEIKNKEALFEIDKKEVNSVSLVDSASKMYGSATVQYLDIKTKTIKTYKAVFNEEISDSLKIYKKCGSIEEAKRIANSALKEQKNEVTGTINLSKPNKLFMAGVNFNLTGLNKFSGLYHIKSHKLRVDNNGLNQEGEICLL